MDRDQLHTKRITSLLTICAAFLMGFIDAYTFMQLDHVFVSAQTGNMVTFGVKLFTGHPYDALANMVAFFGFMCGAFLGEVLLARLRLPGLRRYRLFLYVQALLLLVLALFQTSLELSVMVFVLGLLSGYALTTFRKIGSTPVNNGIMTGNARNMMNSLYLILFEKDEQAKKDMLHLFTGIITFVAGVGASASVSGWDPMAILWIAFGIVCFSIFALFFYKWT
ncbi:YoaK family protein [Sporosarcina sp. D27]|uniref:YoaK family protein n=1 Tax=Sporosarcina sp. D27 TaxID=1382305 RepID=UPI000471A410|nr:YoaK family protein [Sporosarcina sp. D27]